MEGALLVHQLPLQGNHAPRWPGPSPLTELYPPSPPLARRGFLAPLCFLGYLPPCSETSKLRLSVYPLPELESKEGRKPAGAVAAQQCHWPWSWAPRSCCLSDAPSGSAPSWLLLGMSPLTHFLLSRLWAHPLSSFARSVLQPIPGCLDLRTLALKIGFTMLFWAPGGYVRRAQEVWVPARKDRKAQRL